jgi:D-xylose transport system permease protein
MGLLCAVAGIVLTARAGSVSADAGRMMQLDAIAAAVIGGAMIDIDRARDWGTT